MGFAMLKCASAWRVWLRSAPRQPIVLARADSLGLRTHVTTPVQMGTREPPFAPPHDPPIAGNLNCFWLHSEGRSCT